MKQTNIETRLVGKHLGNGIANLWVTALNAPHTTAFHWAILDWIMTIINPWILETQLVNKTAHKWHTMKLLALWWAAGSVSRSTNYLMPDGLFKWNWTDVGFFQMFPLECNEWLNNGHSCYFWSSLSNEECRCHVTNNNTHCGTTWVLRGLIVRLGCQPKEKSWKKALSQRHYNTCWVSMAKQRPRKIGKKKKNETSTNKSHDSNPVRLGAGHISHTRWSTQSSIITNTHVS